MERYRAGYERDYGLRDFDSRRPRYDVGSRGYDRGYYRGERTLPYERPWVGGYHEGYQGGSGGIGVNTSGTGSAYLRGEGTPWRRRNPGYARDYDTGGYHPGWGEYGVHGSRERSRERGGRYVRGARGAYDTGYTGSDREYREDLERNRPRYSPVGGMSPAMGGSAAYDRGYGRRRGYDGGWFNEWSRWF